MIAGMFSIHFLRIVGYLLYICNATVIRNNAHNISAVNISSSKLFDDQHCIQDERLPVLDFEECAAALAYLRELPFSRAPANWGTDNPLDWGHLPVSVSVNDCELSLHAPLHLVAATWVLHDEIAPIAQLIHDCVSDGPRRGGHTLVGPQGHKITASFSATLEAAMEANTASQEAIVN